MARSRSFLERIWILLSANFGTKIISVITAIVLWGIVLGSRNVEVTKEIPLEVITPPDVVPANEIPDRVAFRLSGPKAFLRSILDRREEPIRVNLSGAKPALITYRFFSDSIRVPIGVKVLSISPPSILIKLEYLKRRDVPVRLLLRGETPEGYQVIKAEVKPGTVRIKGPESRVDSITELSTMPIDISNLRGTYDKEVPIDLPKYNVQLDGELPHLFIEVEPTSANFRIKNVDIRVLSSYKVRIEDKNVTLLVRATPKDMQSLDRSHVFAVVDLSGKGKGKYNEPIKITLPKNVGLVKAIPEHVNIVLY